jgi:hypothetical protein
VTTDGPQVVTNGTRVKLTWPGNDTPADEEAAPESRYAPEKASNRYFVKPVSTFATNRVTMGFFKASLYLYFSLQK